MYFYLDVLPFVFFDNSVEESCLFEGLQLFPKIFLFLDKQNLHCREKRFEETNFQGSTVTQCGISPYPKNI
jgi:hypothetical protein